MECIGYKLVFIRKVVGLKEKCKLKWLLIFSGRTSKFAGLVMSVLTITSFAVGFSSNTSYCSTFPNSVLSMGTLTAYLSSLTIVKLYLTENLKKYLSYQISPNLECMKPI